MGIRTRTSSITFEVATPPGVVVSYATWDVATAGAGYTFSGGNLVASKAGSLPSVKSTIGKATGKWYWEITDTDEPLASTFIGVCDDGFNNTTYPGNFANSMSYQSNQWYFNGFSVGPGGLRFLMVSGTVIGFALDADAGKLWVHADGVWKTNDPTGDQAVNVSGTVYACATVWGGSITANFGASAFGYTVPAGFNAGLY